jgi:hypothetical protein
MREYARVIERSGKDVIAVVIVREYDRLVLSDEKSGRRRRARAVRRTHFERRSFAHTR